MSFFRTLFILSVSTIPLVSFADISYTVSPLVIDENVVPRDIISREITLVNTGDIPVTIYPTVNNIALTEGGTIEKFITQVMSDQTRSLAAWIEISRAGIDLHAGETKKATLTLRINPGAEPGEYHALVGFAHGNNRDEAEKKVASGKAPGVIVTTRINDNKRTVLKLAQFVIDKFVISKANTASTFIMKNPGDKPVTPQGEIIFYDAKGREVAAVPVNDEKVTIDPGKEYVFKGTVPLDGLFGKYKAFLSVDYGTENLASIQDTTFFYAVPLRFLLIILSITIVVVAFAAFHIHRKYLDDDSDGSELLPLHVRDTHTAEPFHHDIDLKQK